MGLLRAINPLCANVTAPRHRTARAVEALARGERDNLRESNRAALADLTTRVAAARVAPVSPVPATQATPVLRWSQAHADAIMAAHHAGDRAGVERATQAAYASIGQPCPPVFA